jgi:Rrf2 family protein
MDLIRRNTDYALRAVVYLAKKGTKEPVSARQISKGEKISYQLICKLLQKLQKKGLVKSSMGPRGGFSLNRHPSKINVLEVIETIQGQVTLNRCQAVLSCPLKKKCPLAKELKKLQTNINNFLGKLTLTAFIGKKRK